TFDGWAGERLRYATPQRVNPERAIDEADVPPAVPLPGWAGRAPEWRAIPPPAEISRPERLAPSRPENAELGPVPASASPLAAREALNNRFHRGSLLHALLQHLPDLPRDRRAGATREWLDRPGTGLSPGEVDTLTRETLAILDHPQLAPLFGPGSRA